MTDIPNNEVIYPQPPFGVLGQDQEAYYGIEGTTRLPRQGRMLNWRKGVANVRTGTGRAKIVVMGDSTGMGAGAGTGGTANQTAAFPRSMGARLAEILADTFVATSYQAVWGDQGATVAYGTYDTRVTLGTGWAAAGGPTLGGAFLQFSGGVAGGLEFTPTASTDTVDIYYYGSSGRGSFEVDIGGGAIATIDTDAAAGFYVETVALGSLAAHTISINPVVDGTVSIAGIVAYNSTVDAVDVINGSRLGAGVTSFNDTTSDGALPALALLAPDCTIINLTINNSNSETPLSTYQANLEAIIVSAQTSGDVVLMVGAPSNTVQATDGVLNQYVEVVYNLAERYDCAVVDIKRRWGSYDAIQAYFPYGDDYHPGNLGYADIGQAVVSALTFQ